MLDITRLSEDYQLRRYVTKPLENIGVIEGLDLSKFDKDAVDRLTIYLQRRAGKIADTTWQPSLCRLILVYDVNNCFKSLVRNVSFRTFLNLIFLAHYYNLETLQGYLAYCLHNNMMAKCHDSYWSSYSFGVDFKLTAEEYCQAIKFCHAHSLDQFKLLLFYGHCHRTKLELCYHNNSDIIASLSPTLKREYIKHKKLIFRSGNPYDILKAPADEYIYRPKVDEIRLLIKMDSTKVSKYEQQHVSMMDA